MALPRAFKTDASFLEKIAIGATGTRRTFEDLKAQGHEPMELERGSMSFKIWKAIKIKRIRVPDILCLRCGLRVESRAKTRMEVTMSHSTSNPERGWDAGLQGDDRVALVHCTRSGDEPTSWAASSLVQYVPVGALRDAWRKSLVVVERPKGAQEGFEVRVTWPSVVVTDPGVIEEVAHSSIRYRKAGGAKLTLVRLTRRSGTLTPFVLPGEAVRPGQIIASIVPLTRVFSCPGGADIMTYVRLTESTALGDRYAAVKALARLDDPVATAALARRLQDPKEHIYVRVDAAAGLMLRGSALGREFLAAQLYEDYLENRLEAAIVLGEVSTAESAELLMGTLADSKQHPEIRAGAAWALGEIGLKEALPALVACFNGLDLTIRIEAARALAKIARKHLGDVLRELPRSTSEQRPGIAWALSKAGGFRIEDLLPVLVDDDARQWIAFVIGTQDRDRMLPQIAALATHDPQVYFAVTVLWKIVSSWVYELEEH